MSFGGHQVGSVEYDAKINTDQAKRDAADLEHSLKSSGDAAERAFGQSSTKGLSGLRSQLSGLKSELNASSLSKGLLQGVGIGGGLLAFSSLEKGVEMVGEQFAELVKLGAQAQATQDRLEQAVTNNAGAYDQYAESIDKAVNSGIRLAFTDAEQKDALGSLVVKTKDVNRAISDLAIAEDVARGRKISLSEASDLVGKAELRQFGALKRAGIEIDKNATSTQALAQIEAAYHGQAATYAATDQGRWGAINAKIEQVKEEIGEKLQPVLDVALSTIDDILNPPTYQESPALAGLIDQYQKLNGVSGSLNASSGGALDGVNALTAGLSKLIDQAGPAAAGLVNVGQAVLQGKGDVQQLDILLADMGKQAGLSAADVDTLSTSVINGNITLDQALEILQKLIQKQKDAAGAQARHNDEVARGALSLDNLTSAEQRYQARLEALAHSPGVNVGKLIKFPSAQTIEQQAEGIGEAFSGGIKQGLDANVRAVALASSNLRYAVKNPMAILAEKGGFGWLVGKITAEGLAEKLKSKNPEIRAEAEAKRAIIVNALSNMPSYAWGSQIAADYLAGLRAAGLMKYPSGWGVKFNTGINSDWTWHVPQQGGHTPGKAAGGTVDAWSTYLVGEKGPELLTMGGRGGYITPNAQMIGGGTVRHEVSGSVKVELSGASIAAARAQGASWDDVGRMARSANGLIAGLQMRLGTNG